MSAAVTIKGKEGNRIRIPEGARQGCGLSPEFFNADGEEIMEKTENMEGVIIGGRNINNLRFADDARRLHKREATGISESDE